MCDIDVVGISSTAADAELLAVANDVFRSLDLDVIIEVNSRKLLTDIINYCDITVDQATQVIISIDKLKKIGVSGVKNELLEKEISNESIEKLIFILKDLEKGNNLEKLNYIENIIGNSAGLKELKELFNYLSQFKVTFYFPHLLQEVLDITQDQFLKYF
jgi:histidyl-tRNA synthetase